MSSKPLTKERIRAILNLLPVLLNTVAESEELFPGCGGDTRRGPHLDRIVEFSEQGLAAPEPSLDTTEPETPDDGASSADVHEALRQHLRCLIGAVGENVRQFLLDSKRLLEIAGYVRQGGVKSMVYRLETGLSLPLAPNYFAGAIERLFIIARQGELTDAGFEANHSCLERLASIAPEEEDAVASCMSQLDEILLSRSRRQSLAIEEP